MPSTGRDRSAGIVRTPAQIESEALHQIHFLTGEYLQRVWKTARGFLVMTNLRCIEVLRKPQVFATSDWEAGPSIFFYNLSAPKVEFHRFLRLSEEREERTLVMRFFLHDPYQVAQEIEGARIAGQNEWLRRRSQAEGALRLSRERWEAAHPLGLGEELKRAVKVRCGFCGNLMEITATRCPFCGAPPK
jgi:hypothetical protein